MEVAGDRVEGFLEVKRAGVEGAALGACLGDEGVQGEDVVCGAVVAAEAGLGGGTGGGGFCPVGQAGL